MHAVLRCCMRKGLQRTNGILTARLVKNSVTENKGGQHTYMGFVKALVCAWLPFVVRWLATT